MEQNKTYKTKDIFEGAWLYSLDIPLVELSPDNDYFWFVFLDEKARKSSSEYWSKNAIGNIKKFVDSFKTLKDLVFSQRTNTGRVYDN